MPEMKTNIGSVQLLREPGLLERLHAEIQDWCRGRWFSVRIPLLLLMAYIGAKQFGDPFYNSLFGGINLGIHEGGHLLFRSGGRFLHVLGGTFLQTLAPLASMVMFLRQRDYFAIAICFGWLSTNLINIGVYMADAQKMDLPLVTVGDAKFIIHDWHYLFSTTGLLSLCETIGGLTRGIGHCCMLICVVAGGWMLWMMYRLPPKPRQTVKV
jgi:hypothetical protein